MANREIKDWFLATRPWSFSASIIPVLAIGAYLFFMCNEDLIDFQIVNALLALPMMVLFQASGNLISDYYDYNRKVDLPDSLNGVRHIQSGKFQPKEILYFGYCLLLVALLLGLVILLRSSLSYFWLGLAAFVLVVFYPTLKYRALGDLNIFLGYVFLPAVGLNLICCNTFIPNVMLVCIPFGILTVAILHANNTRDIQNDKRAKIITLPILTGYNFSRRLYMVEVASAYVLSFVLVVLNILPVFCLITFLSLPLAFKNIKTIYKNKSGNDKAILRLDQTTAQMQLTFGALYTIGFILSLLLL